MCHNPRELPAVTALPLDPPSDSGIEAIVQVATSETVKPCPTPPYKGGEKTDLSPPSQGGVKGGSNRELPPGAKTIFFGVPTSGASVVYVIDRSASMGLEGRLQRAVAEAIVSLNELPATTRLQVIAYASSPDKLMPGPSLTAAEPMAITTACERLRSLAAEGGTDHARALKSALIMNPDVVFFLTDEDELTANDVKSITEYNRGRSAIHAICLVDPGSGSSPMKELAKRNRGEFRVAK